ncbi:MAG: GTP 3',8-cyclase MoaA [Pseudomonadota bacterium]
MSTTAPTAPITAPITPTPLIDPFGRAITYLRVSVTDRCDFRCVYCMAETMTFLPKADLLSLEELAELCQTFIELGVRKIRLTGGEPLVRRNILKLFETLGRSLAKGTLEELTLTTNGSQLSRYADELKAFGVKRVNISLDTLNPDTFTRLTRWGRFDRVMDGIKAAQRAGLAVKINTVALGGADGNQDEFDHLIAWCGENGYDMTLIEVMPMGDIGGEERLNQYLPLAQVEKDLARRWTLTPLADQTGGPARYVRVEETGGRLGFITPLTHNFCEGCNRVRVTCTGQLFMCLGQNDQADLRAALRAGTLREAIRQAIGRKPKGHDFVIDRAAPNVAVPRYMSTTGG